MQKKKPKWTKTRYTIEAEDCRRSAQYFVFDKLLSKDEHDTRNPIKRFPNHPYLRALLDCLMVSGHITRPTEAHVALQAGFSPEWLSDLYASGVFAVEKSRQMMVTWLVCAYLLWRAKYLSHQLILVQSKKEEDAANLVFVKEPHVARISFMEVHLPSHLRSCVFPKAGTYAHLYFPNGSHIWGIPQGADVIRSNTPSVWFSDESGYQPEFDPSYTAALPAVKGGGQAICVSSAEPGAFQELVEAT